MPGSRRSFLISGLGARLLAQAGRGAAFPGAVRRYPDPMTEFDVYLLTDPAHTSLLPAHYNRAITKNSATLLFTSDRPGSPQAFRMDLKNAQTRQLTDATDLDAALAHAHPGQPLLLLLRRANALPRQSRRHCANGSFTKFPKDGSDVRA